jgi:membrane-associated HD superfamily phosphohydrolase
MHSMMSSNRVQGIIELFSFILEPVQLIQTCFQNSWFQFGDDFPVTQALQQFSIVASTVFPSDSYDGSLTELFATFGIVAVVLMTSAYVGFRLSYTSSSPNRALAFLRVIVLILVSYLFMPSQEIVGKFLLPYQAPNGDWLFLVFQSENIPIQPAIMVVAWIVFILFGAISAFVVTLAVTTEGFFGQAHGRADLVMMVGAYICCPRNSWR